MKCIDDVLVQKYIDGEATLQEAVRIRKHAEECVGCSLNIKERRAFAEGIKWDIRCMGSQPVGIPEFVAPAAIKYGGRFRIRHYAYAVSAACILFLAIFLIPKKAKEREIQLIYSFEDDFDANRPVSQQEMVIRVVDPNGKVTEL